MEQQKWLIALKGVWLFAPFSSRKTYYVSVKTHHFSFSTGWNGFEIAQPYLLNT